ncbi:MAG: mechanosensitive ion channel family protein [Erysipelotrichaceae bacterium]|nr:mechanosensitive ion channel family protein [Erysipelotrichaceae bacterium]
MNDTKTNNPWVDFWTSVGNFFLAKDDYGVNYLTRILIAIAIIVLGWLLIRFIGFLLKKAFGIKKKGPEIDVSAKFFIVNIIKIALWLGVAFIVVWILRIDTTGIAGVTSAITVAIGLSLQDLIGCFASGIVILQQKHIVTGDYISVSNGLGTAEGTVTKIHFFMTYLKTPNGQEVTIPNNNMQKAIVTNYTRLGKRRMDYDVGVSYNSDIALVKKVLTDLVKDDTRRLKDEDLSVYVYELGPYAVGVRIRLWTKFDEYWSLYNELSEKVLLACRKNNIYIPSSTDRVVQNVDQF